MREDFFLPMVLEVEDKTSPLQNRICKNYRHIRKWAKKTKTNCFRLYDRDIKEYPLAIDFYNGLFLVQYFPIDRDFQEKEQIFKELVKGILFTLFHAQENQVFWRTKVKRAQMEQYEKIAEKKKLLQVLEHGVRFLVNVTDYQDVGLFLDHRPLRQKVASLAKGKSVLNLFAYTCSFSVHAAMAGACFTKSVDLSNAYTQWGEENFFCNQLSLHDHPIVRADCLQFIEDELAFGRRYDLIVIDPPTISRSQKMEKMFDIQKDYEWLLTRALLLLKKGGILFFSTNSRKFVFDETLFPSYRIKDISKQTIPLDFHSQKIHKSWEFHQLS